MKSSLRSVETSISLSNIQDQVASFLYATGVVHDNEDIQEITFGKGLGREGQIDGLVPITIKIKSQERMQLLEI